MGLEIFADTDDDLYGMFGLGETAEAGLRPGMSGNAVFELQRALNKKGFKVIANGQYGQSTMNAVAKFQVSMGMSADGVAGPRVLRALGLSSLITAATPAAPAAVPGKPKPKLRKRTAAARLPALPEPGAVPESAAAGETPFWKRPAVIGGAILAVAAIGFAVTRQRRVAAIADAMEDSTCVKHSRGGECECWELRDGQVVCVQD